MGTVWRIVLFSGSVLGRAFFSLVGRLPSGEPHREPEHTKGDQSYDKLVEATRLAVQD